MEVVSNNCMPGDPRLIDHIVYELKSQGIFDHFRKECIADVDTKPAYQNLRQRVEGSVSGFLKTQRWRPDMNKNQVREMLRKNISESGFLETGVERIVDQVVNPKINSIFLPQVENVVYKCLGIQKPSAFDDLRNQINLEPLDSCERLDISNNLLPSDLETVSPESEPHEKKLDMSNESQKLEDSRMDEDESPPFEPLEESTSFMVQEENSVDSHLSGFSGLASHDSNQSLGVMNKITPMEISNQDSHLSRQSSDGHLSIVMSDETDTKIEMNEDSTLSKASNSKATDSTSKSFDFLHDTQSSSDKSLQNTVKQEKPEDSKKPDEKSKCDEKKSDRHRSSHKHKSRHDSRSASRDHKGDKERRSDRDKKESREKNGHSSKDQKDRDRERKNSKSKNGKDEGDSKSEKHEKERDRSRNSSKHSSSKDKGSSKKDSSESKTKELETKDSKSKESEHKDSKPKSSKEKGESSKSRDDSKSKSESKSRNSDKSKGDSKSFSKHNGKSKPDSSDAGKSSSKSSKRDDKSYKKDEKHHSRSSSSRKDDKDKKKDVKKDDHYSLKGKKTNRRSTDRDSSDGHSGTHSSSSSFADLSLSSQQQKSSQDNSTANSGSSSGDSGNSDQVAAEIEANVSANRGNIATIHQLPPVKLIKPKFASNIFEARRLMKIRKKLGKLEKQSQMELISSSVALNNSLVCTEDKNISNHVLTYEIVPVPDELGNSENSKRRPNILKKQPNILKSASKSSSAKTNVLTSHLNITAAQFYNDEKKGAENSKHMVKDLESEEEDVAEVVEISDDSNSTPLRNSVISKESWDAVEAKLNMENILKVDYNSYTDSSEDFKKVVEEQSKTSRDEAKEENCLGVENDVLLEAQKHVSVMWTFITQLEEDLARRSKFAALKMTQLSKHATNTANVKEVDGLGRRLPKVAIVDVTSDNEIVISPSKGIKRHADDHPDVHNNNKTSNEFGIELLDERLNHLTEKVNHPMKMTIGKAKKAKIIDSSVNQVDNFNLPLSPAESDKSFSTTGDRKTEKVDGRNKRNSSSGRALNNARNQRYSSDDLYKPRLQFSSTRRRITKNSDVN